MRQGRVYDLSFFRIPDPGWVARRVAEGVELFIQDVWTGGYANNDSLRTVAEHNLRMIREGGGRAAIYTNAAPWRTPQLWFEESVRNAGAEITHVNLVVIDLEIAEDNLYINPDDVLAFIKLWEDAGFVVWTYSGDWYVGFWKLLLGDANRVNFGKPYWHARYDGIADLMVNPPRHPLGPLAGKQYGWTDIEGGTVDLNVFDMDQVTGVLVPQPQTEEDWFAMATEEQLRAIVHDELRKWGARVPMVLTDNMSRLPTVFRIEAFVKRAHHWFSFMAPSNASFESAWVHEDGTRTHQGVNQINNGKPFVIALPGPDQTPNSIAGIWLRRISGRITVIDYSLETTD